ncbi:MAG: 3-phosphoshikimate 1-carboxyvinyltransferase, partial [Elusimicrobia bacterium]|nr:3-phosphoshikimate 1-carboxyvinyltransferase [Elusimicrobiota bacterium]
ELGPLRPGPEPSRDIVAAPARLRAANISPDEVPDLIDELPLLALAATQAEGTSRFRGLGELRRKESDRLSGTKELLGRFGARLRARGDELSITGPTPLIAARIDPRADHRLAMTAAVAGLIARGETIIEHAECIAKSYPSFGATLSETSETRRP